MKPERPYTHRWGRKRCRLLITDHRRDEVLIEVEGEKKERVVPRSEVTKA